MDVYIGEGEGFGGDGISVDLALGRGAGALGIFEYFLRGFKFVCVRVVRKCELVVDFLRVGLTTSCNWKWKVRERRMQS